MKKVIYIILVSIILLTLIVGISQIGLKALPYILESVCTDYIKIRKSSYEELKSILEIEDANSFELIYIKYVRGGFRKWW